MSEVNFGKGEALKRTVANVARFAGSILRGEFVLVPLERTAYAEQVNDVMEAMPGWRTDTMLVHEALRTATRPDHEPGLQSDEVWG